MFNIEDYEFKTTPAEYKVSVVAFPIKVWLLMLIVGAIGHRMNLHYLYNFGYFDVLLVKLGFGMLLPIGNVDKEFKRKKGKKS